MHAWLENQIGQSAANIITSLVVLIVVIAAIAITISLLRKFNNGTFVVGGKSRTPRLSVRDAAAVDRTRRLVLVRRDNVEHLLMIGGPTDIVIETNIKIGEMAGKEPGLFTPSDKLAENPQPAQSFRETRFTNPTPAENISVSPLQHRANDRSGIKPNPAPGSLNVTQSTGNFTNISPELNIRPADENKVDNRSVEPPVFSPRDRSAPDFSPLPTGRVSPRLHEKPPVTPDFAPTVRDSTIGAEIEGRRDPSLGTVQKTIDPAVNLDDDFDHMFEDELKDAIKNEKH